MTESLIDEIAIEMSKNHAKIIEKELKSVIEKYKVSNDKLTLEIHAHTSFVIKINASNFSIENKFIYEA